MATQYAGAWKRATLPDNQLPLKPGIDPEHSKPTDTLDPNAVDNTGAPQLPYEWSGGQYLQAFVPSEFVDFTPESHEIGVGFLPGVDQETAQYIGGRARNEDLGASDQSGYARPQYQEDGSTHQEIYNTDLHGASPGNLVYAEKGVGVALDPYARTNRRIKEFATGPVEYDMRWYGSEMRPRYLHTGAGSKPARGPVAGRQPNSPPEGAGSILRPDNWAPAIVRRAAPSWDQPFATDAEVPASGFGLGSWGL